MNTVVVTEIFIENVEVTDETITTYLADGRTISVPMAHLRPVLARLPGIRQPNYRLLTLAWKNLPDLGPPFFQ